MYRPRMLNISVNGKNKNNLPVRSFFSCNIIAIWCNVKLSNLEAMWRKCLSVLGSCQQTGNQHSVSGKKQTNDNLNG